MTTSRSVGYKNPEVRKRRKPVKNHAPMQVDFGRSPAWNCFDHRRDIAPKSPVREQPVSNWIENDAHFSDYDGDDDVSQQHPSTVAPLADRNLYSDDIQVGT